MIGSFGDRATAEHYAGTKMHKKLNQTQAQRARVLLFSMDDAESLDELKLWCEPPSLRLHKLKYDRKNYHAIDIDKISGWRITFIWEGGKFHEVTIEDYHKK